MNIILLSGNISAKQAMSAEEQMLREKHCGVSIIFRNEDAENEATKEAEVWFVVNEYHPAVWELLKDAGYVK